MNELTYKNKTRTLTEVIYIHVGDRSLIFKISIPGSIKICVMLENKWECLMSGQVQVTSEWVHISWGFNLKRPWCWERLRAGGEEDDRGWDGWMASPTQWTWVLVGSGSWWWTGRPGVMQSMGSQRVGHDWATTQLNWGVNKCSI